MGSATAHTLRAFDHDLENLRALVCEMGGRVEAALIAALVVLEFADEEQADRVSGECERSASMSETIEKSALCFLALRAPRADDLQHAMVALKVAETLTAMARGVRGIVERAQHLRAWRSSDELRMLRRMSLGVTDMARLALDAFARGDRCSVPDLEERDDAVDALHRSVIASLHRRMSEETDRLCSGMHLLLIARGIERLGDCATKIARIAGMSLPSPPAVTREVAMAAGTA